MPKRPKQSKLVGSKEILARTDIGDEEIRFSFKHLDLVQNENFSIEQKDPAYFTILFERFRAVNGWKVRSFQTRCDISLRNHKIDWNDTTTPDGFSHLNQQLRDYPAWQFQLSKSENGRVHGFFIDFTFYIVWLDPDHKLYAKA